LPVYHAWRVLYSTSYDTVTFAWCRHTYSQTMLPMLDSRQSSDVTTGDSTDVLEAIEMTIWSRSR